MSRLVAVVATGLLLVVGVACGDADDETRYGPFRWTAGSSGFGVRQAEEASFSDLRLGHVAFGSTELLSVEPLNVPQDLRVLGVTVHLPRENRGNHGGLVGGYPLAGVSLRSLPTRLGRGDTAVITVGLNADQPGRYVLRRLRMRYRRFWRTREVLLPVRLTLRVRSEADQTAPKMVVPTRRAGS